MIFQSTVFDFSESSSPRTALSKPTCRDRGHHHLNLSWSSVLAPTSSKNLPHREEGNVGDSSSNTCLQYLWAQDITYALLPRRVLVSHETYETVSGPMEKGQKKTMPLTSLIDGIVNKSSLMLMETRFWQVFEFYSWSLSCLCIILLPSEGWPKQVTTHQGTNGEINLYHHVASRRAQAHQYRRNNCKKKRYFRPYVPFAATRYAERRFYLSQISLFTHEGLPNIRLAAHVWMELFVVFIAPRMFVKIMKWFIARFFYYNFPVFPNSTTKNGPPNP